MMFALLLVQVAPAAAPPPARDQRDVVVVGRQLEEALAQCLARHCTVSEDAAASLALARRQFVDGDYRGARGTLDASLRRNRRHSRTDPLPVAALWRDKARIESHLGHYDWVRASVLQLYQTHRQGLAENDPERLAGLIELGDMEFHLGRPVSAGEFYREARSSAERAGQTKVAAIARYRLANVAMIRSRGGPTASDEREVAEWLAPLIGSPHPQLARFDFPARLMKARVAERRGAKGQVDLVLQTMPRGTRAAPRLVAGDPVRLGDAVQNDCLESLTNAASQGRPFKGVGCDDPRNRQPSADVERQWIDVAFRIAGDGGVADVDVVRRSDRYRGDWARNVVTSVQSRRYAVPRGEAEAGPIIRLERFTLTAPYETATGRPPARARAQPRGRDGGPDAGPARHVSGLRRDSGAAATTAPPQRLPPECRSPRGWVRRSRRVPAMAHASPVAKKREPTESR